jgi:hypothetical protein
MFPFPNIFLAFTNRLLLILLAVCILMIPISHFFLKQINGLGWIAELLVIYAGFSLFIKNGEFAKTVYAEYANVSIAIVAVSIALKVLKIMFANYILVAAIASTVLIYLFYFFAIKKQHTFTAYLKLFFLVAIITTQSFFMFHLPNSHLVYFIFQPLALISILLFVLLNFQALKNS